MKIVVQYDLLLPQQCKNCDDIFNDDNMFIEAAKCFICRRNMCPKCIPDQNIPGLLPVCDSCEKKYSHEDNPMNTEVSENVDNESVVHNEEEEVSTPLSNVECPSESSNNDKNDKICKHYLMGKCRHGRQGDDCSYHHPKLCFKFLNKGSDGCKLENCEFTHPKMCRFEIKCNKQDCKYLHPKKRKLLKNTSEKEVLGNPVRESSDRNNGSEREVFRPPPPHPHPPPPPPPPRYPPPQCPQYHYPPHPQAQEDTLSEIKAALKELTQNVGILMKERENAQWG